MPLITIKSIYFKIVLIGLYSAFSSNLFAHEPILICIEQCRVILKTPK